MESKPKTLGRAHLIGMLRERGWSRRDAVRILNRVIHEMTEALRRGEAHKHLQEAIYGQTRARRKGVQAAE
jgi:hypothetical protein